MRLFRLASLLPALLLAALVLGGADGCSSDPNVEGARLYLRQGDFDAAIGNLDTALAENPDNTDALALKAEVLRQKIERAPAAERPALAQQMVQAIERAYALAPTDTEIAQQRLIIWGSEMNRGATLLRSSSNDAAAAQAAVGAFENATTLVPDSSVGHFNLGLAQLVSGNTEGSIAPLERAIEMGTNDENAYLYLSRAYLAAERGTEAVALLENARTRFPENDALEAELLNAYAATAQADRAIAAYEQIIAGDPDNPVYRYNYGSLLLQAERYDDAAEQLQRAVELDPTNANAQFNLGAVYQNQAATLSRQINETDDAARVAQLETQRDALLDRALPALVEARRLTEANGENARDVCDALFRIYVQLNRTAEAEEAGQCAGMNMN